MCWRALKKSSNLRFCRWQSSVFLSSLQVAYFFCLIICFPLTEETKRTFGVKKKNMEDGRWGKKALNHPGAVWSEQDDPAHILYRVVVFSFSVSDHIMLSFCLNLSAEGKFFLVNIGRMSTHSPLKAFQMRHLADQSVLHASLTGQVKIFCQNKRADPFVWFEKVRLAPGGRTQRWIPPLPSTCAQCMSQQIIHASKDSILD